jgi:hypothetical protein
LPGRVGKREILANRQAFSGLQASLFFNTTAQRAPSKPIADKASDRTKTGGRFVSRLPRSGGENVHWA